MSSSDLAAADKAHECARRRRWRCSLCSAWGQAGRGRRRLARASVPRIVEAVLWIGRASGVR